MTSRCRRYAVVLAVLLAGLRGQEPPPPPAPVPAPTPQQDPLPAGHPPVERPAAEPPVSERPAGERPAGDEPDPGATGPRRGGRRGVRGQDPTRQGQRGEGDAQDPEREDAPAAAPKPPRRGIPVHDLMVETHCARCHERNAEGLMTRISYLRKSPEGWSETLKRMIRLHGVQMSPAEAKEMVRYLATEHGLTRSESERSLYESERRVHWSEEHHDQDFRQACSACHPLGRVLAQARDDEEWQLLRATHVAMFPLAQGQMGGGAPDDEERRGEGGPGTQGGSGQGGGTRGGGGTGTARAGQGTGARGQGQGGGQGAAEADAEAARRFGGGQAGDRGDRVLRALSESQPLFTPEYEQWVANRREVPLAGSWTVTGHEIGRGDLLGTAVLTRTGIDEYDVQWQFSFQNGDRIERPGKGLLYAGYSWRGRTTDPGEGGRTWREVLLLDERWETMRGRIFTGDYDEFGVDVVLTRHRGQPRVLAVASPWVTVPAQGQQLDVFGEQFPEQMTAGDFHLGKGVTVRDCERLAGNHVRLLLDVAPGTDCGQREVAYGPEPGRVRIQLYDAVDYVRVRPLQGLARIGGERFPKQFERYEAVAVHRGPDQKPYTDDDIDLWMVPATWKLVESPVREDDDDLRFVGAIDADSGLFTPAIEGPNQQRKWSGNNTGEVYVECTAKLHVPVRPATPPPPATEATPSTAADETPGAAASVDQGAGAAPEHRLEAAHSAARPAAKPAATPAAAEQDPGAQAAAGQNPTGQDPTGQAQAPTGQEPARQEPAASKPAPPKPTAQGTHQRSPSTQEPAPTSGQPTLEQRTFRARAHLLVTVPQYVRWQVLEWEDR